MADNRPLLLIKLRLENMAYICRQLGFWILHLKQTDFIQISLAVLDSCRPPPSGLALLTETEQKRALAFCGKERGRASAKQFLLSRPPVRLSCFLPRGGEVHQEPRSVNIKGYPHRDGNIKKWQPQLGTTLLNSPGFLFTFSFSMGLPLEKLTLIHMNSFDIFYKHLLIT